MATTNKERVEIVAGLASEALGLAQDASPQPYGIETDKEQIRDLARAVILLAQAIGYLADCVKDEG